MRDYRDGKWAKSILSLQLADGSWGYFHTLSDPTPSRPMTTEQALRRLEFLGFTKEDPAIAKALSYLRACLSGETTIPDRREKSHDWDVYVELMLSVWIRRFDAQDERASATAEKWRRMMERAFASGSFCAGDYAEEYSALVGRQPKGDRLVDFVAFYPVSLLTGEIAPTIERAYFDHIVSRAGGVYYIYGAPLDTLPPSFQSKQASRYLAAIELLLAYPNAYACTRLRFVYDWLLDHRAPDGTWDMGPDVRDGVYFPLSDSWRDPKDRAADCTRRIGAIIAKFEDRQS